MGGVTMGGVSGTQRFFVVRVMKTGSGSLTRHALNTFGRRGIFPAGGIDVNPSDQRGAASIPFLLDLPSERRAEIRVYIGHFPYAAYQKMGVECTTVTIVRHPVARILSHLRHVARQPQYHGMEIEAIYDHPFAFPFFLHNHQIKYFAMTTDDPLYSMMGAVDVDDARIAIAKANLEQIDVLGLTESYDEFLDELRVRYGWEIQRKIVANASTEDWEPSATLRRRIEADSTAELEFYEYARELSAARKRERGSV